ncbi:MAG: lycopene cyclase domain-containing protein [Thermodesulfobacteriota bacterium]
MSVDALGPWSYLVWLLAWSLPIVLGQWLAFPGLLARTRGRWLPPSLALGAYFATADAIGIATGVWQIADQATLGVRIAGVLPLEEALFFFLTTLMVAQTTALFLWRFGDLPGEPWRGWRAAFGW